MDSQQVSVPGAGARHTMGAQHALTSFPRQGWKSPTGCSIQPLTARAGVLVRAGAQRQPALSEGLPHGGLSAHGPLGPFTAVIAEAQSLWVAQSQPGVEPGSGFSALCCLWGGRVGAAQDEGSLWGLHRSAAFRARALEPLARTDTPKAGLAGVAQWIEHQPAKQRVVGLVPSQGTCLGCGLGPW